MTICPTCWNRGRSLWAGSCICTSDALSSSQLEAASAQMRRELGEGRIHLPARAPALQLAAKPSKPKKRP